MACRYSCLGTDLVALGRADRPTSQLRLLRPRVPFPWTSAMSVAGLRFTRNTSSSSMAETKSGSYIYGGDPSTYHDWEFRTLLRLKLYEDAIRAKASAQSRQGSQRGDSDAGGARAEAEPGAGDDGEDPDGPGEDDGEDPPRPAADATQSGATRDDAYFDFETLSSRGGRGKGRGDKSPRIFSMESAELAPASTKARTEMVHRVLEGLRDDAFDLARDMGVEALTAPGGLRRYIAKLREMVFPRAAEEARELFRVGQRPGTLSRQSGESMLSYVSRRRRWWKLLKTLDSSIELSEPMRVELLLELSGLSRQESLVIKACTKDSKGFESVAEILVEHYTGVHLKEGRALGGSMPSAKGTGRTPFYKGKGKGKSRGFPRRAYAAFDDEIAKEEDSHEPLDYIPEAYVAEEQWGDEDVEEEFEEYEVDDAEAVALNTLELFEDQTPEAGHAIQLSLAAHTAVGKAKGKGRKGRGKGKGKVVRSHLTLEQRRDKLKALKAKSKCLRCGGTGHWAGDPECKFPAGTGKSGGKAANVAVMACADLSRPTDSTYRLAHRT